MQIFYNKKVDFVAKRMLPGIVVLGIAGWGAAFGSADIQNVPELLDLDAVALANDTDQANTEVFSGTYQDGTYQGTAQGWGGTIEVEVTITGGKITAIEVTSAGGETSAYLNRAKGLIATMLEKQTASVDVVSGATYSSNGIINAVKAALLKAQTGDTGKDAVTNTGGLGSASAGGSGSTSSAAFTDGTYQDGTYTGSAKGWGGTITVSVTISGGKISAVNIVSASGETAAYFNKAKILTSTVVAKQTPNVDAVSGATYSSNGILNAIKVALSKAQTGDNTSSDDNDVNNNSTSTQPDNKPSESEEEFPTASAYKAGIYTGTATVENFDYDVSLNVYINKLGKIVDIEEADGNDYDGNEDYMQSALTGASTNGKGTILSQLKATACADLGSIKVDAVSGATYSSHAIVSAVKNAVKQAGTEESAEPDEETPDTPDTLPDTPDTEPEQPEEESKPTEDETISTHPKANGTYDGTATVIDGMEMFETGNYELSLAVTTENGKVTDIRLTSNVADSNASYMERAWNGYTRKGIYYTSIPAQFLDMRIEDIASTSIDVVSGATYSSDAIAEAVKQALS